MVELLNIDCMEYMAGLPDKAFDIAIVDPPYGIGASNYKRGGTKHGKSMAKCKNYGLKDWDSSIPEALYFAELKRVSNNQIIWGWNYFVQHLNNCPSYIVWNKDNGDNLYADCESAWCSIHGAARVFKYKWHGMLQEKMGKRKEERVHPTQKPIALYAWLFKNYCKPGDKILDTHLGSCSSAIAAEKMGFDFVGCEIDKEIFDIGLNRFKKETDLGLFSTVGK